MSRAAGDGTEPGPAPSAPLQQRNIDAIAKVETAVLGERSAGERAVRWLTRNVGTPASVVLHGAAIAAWIAWNARLHGALPAFDPSPYPLLSLVASVEAILLGLLILTSQNRLRHEEDRRAHLTLQIGMMAEREGTQMLQMLNRLCRQADVAGADPDLLDELTSDTDPETIAATLKSSMPVEG